MGKEDLLTKGAILQRDAETYTITARLVGGVMDFETGRRIADTAEKYGVEMLKITGDGRLALIGVTLEAILHDVDRPTFRHPGLHRSLVKMGSLPCLDAQGSGGAPEAKKRR